MNLETGRPNERDYLHINVYSSFIQDRSSLQQNMRQTQECLSEKYFMIYENAEDVNEKHKLRGTHQHVEVGRIRKQFRGRGSPQSHALADYK